MEVTTEPIINYDKTYLDYIVIVSRVVGNKCWYTLFHHFDLFAKVDRIYPDQSYYSWLVLLNEPSHIIDNIYLGSAFNAADKKLLELNHFDMIINATKSISNYFPDDFTYHNYPADDLDGGSLKEHYENFYQTVLAFENQNDGSAKILVHCYAGRSRSAALVLYYLTKRYQMTITEALELLTKKRPLVNINQEFIREIQEIIST